MQKYKYLVLLLAVLTVALPLCAGCSQDGANKGGQAIQPGDYTKEPGMGGQKK